jgi:exonuclease III
MDKAMNKGISEQLHIATWNVRGLSGKENKMERELLRAHIDVAIISETKKKLKSLKDLQYYLLYYSGEPQEQCLQE